MRRETELFFENLVREDRSLLELLDADYTFVNERLANHYGIPGVVGDDFRRVAYPDDRRQGILGHGSMLVQTSFGNRTSPVLRGKWVMEVLLGTPPPPPPPNVPTLDETTGDDAPAGLVTTADRLRMHRANPTCNSCHQLIDPIGMALDNFDVTGQWRARENGLELDTKESSTTAARSRRRRTWRRAQAAADPVRAALHAEPDDLCAWDEGWIISTSRPCAPSPARPRRTTTACPPSCSAW
jgi:hypothetical protein